MSTVVAADLHFELERPDAGPVRGHLTGHDNQLVLDVDHPGAFAGPDDASAIRALAAGLAARGMTVRVVSGETHLVTLGSVRAPWWQRRATRSRHIRLGSLRGAFTSARSRARGVAPVLPSSTLLPPATLWPPAPTFARRSRRRITGTHDPARGGGARLVVEKAHMWGGERQPIYWLAPEDETTIGSDPSCAIRLDGLAPRHAMVRHDPDDEFVVLALEGETRVHGASVAGRQILRTGARVEVGEHVLAFFREEYADHGRPHYGRLGGEAGRQEPQPRREETAADTAPGPDDGPPGGGRGRHRHAGD